MSARTPVQSTYISGGTSSRSSLGGGGGGGMELEEAEVWAGARCSCERRKAAKEQTAAPATVKQSTDAMTTMLCVGGSAPFFRAWWSGRSARELDGTIQCEAGGFLEARVWRIPTGSTANGPSTSSVRRGHDAKVWVRDTARERLI